MILFLSLRGFDFIGQLPYSLLPLAVFVAFCFFIRFVSKCIVILLTSEGNDPFYGRYDKTLLRTILILVTAFVPYVIVLLISLGQQ